MSAGPLCMAPIGPVRGGRLDAVDGTPLPDIKPVWTGDRPREEVREPAWVKTWMANDW